MSAPIDNQLKHVYTDFRGLRIGDDNILNLLKEIGTTEQAVIDIVGPVALEPGFMGNFLQSLIVKINWCDPVKREAQRVKQEAWRVKFEAGDMGGFKRMVAINEGLIERDEDASTKE